MCRRIAFSVMIPVTERNDLLRLVENITDNIGISIFIDGHTCRGVGNPDNADTFLNTGCGDRLINAMIDDQHLGSRTGIDRDPFQHKYNVLPVTHDCNRFFPEKQCNLLSVSGVLYYEERKYDDKTDNKK